MLQATRSRARAHVAAPSVELVSLKLIKPG
jgi:hypothetical protein